jgi:hypothetical protein
MQPGQWKKGLCPWPEIEKPLLEGAIVTLEDAAFRVRRLPIAHEERAAFCKHFCIKWRVDANFGIGGKL